MNTNFGMWLTGEMDQRGWTNSELARRAEIKPSTISKIISGHINPGIESCLGIARALGYPPERIMREADVLPPSAEGDPRFLELLEIVKNLDSSELENILDFATFLYQKQERKRRNESD